MMTRKVRIQILAFVLIALVGVSYAGFRYAGLDRMFGSRGYVVTLRLAESGGIFTNAEVAYRGVTVGRVGPLHLTKDGLEVELDIDSGAPPVPADTQAVVANRSAVGEQFVDLRPKVDGAPFLKAGSIITQDRAKTPPAVDGLLTNLDNFAASVPADSLRTVVNELDNAFRGTGPQLQALLDSANAWTRTAEAHLPQTIQLIKDGRTVLDTQNHQSSAITSFSSDLRLVAEQLKNSDGDLRRLITAAPAASEQISGLIRESGPQLGVLVANLLTTANIALTRQDGIELVMVTYPAAVAGSFTVAPGDGTAHFGLALNVFDPMPCTKGYEGTQKRAGNDLTPIEPNTKAYCAEPPGSPSTVRGAQNAPYGGKPVSPPPVSSPTRPAPTAIQQAPLPFGGGSAPVLTTLAQLLGLAGGTK